MHYFDPFGRTDPDALLTDPLIIIRDKAFLFWDQEPYHPEIHNSTINWFCANFNVTSQKTKVTFVTSEKDSANVNALADTYGFNTSYYFFNAWASLDWFRGYNRMFIMPEFKNRDITNTFICKNRVVSGKREHRIDLITNLATYNLLKNNNVSFPATCPYSGEEMHIEGINLPLIIGNEESGNIPNESYKISLWGESKNSLLDVVTETVYNEKTLHLTEKIFKPIVMQMPFILVGAQHNLAYLKSYGFKTFSDCWSEDYDHQPNDTRIESITKILIELDNLSLKEKAQLQRHLTPIVEHNFNWFYSKEFENLLWKEITTMTSIWK
jgi:hypothetical protein